MASEASDTLVAPASRPEAPERHEAARSSAASPPPVAPRPSNRQLGRDQLNAIGQGMKDGTVMDRRDANRVAENLQQTPATSTPSKPSTPVKAPPTGSSPQTQSTPEQAAAAAAQAKNLAVAKRVLARDGWHPEDFERFEPADIIARATQRAKAHAEVDRVYGEYTRLQKQPRQADGTFAAKPEVAAPAATGKDAPIPTAEAAQAPQGDLEIDALIAAAKEKIGEPAAQLLTQITAALSHKFGQRVATSEFLAKEGLLQTGQTLFAELYPTQAAADPALFDEVRQNFEVLLTTGRYDSGQVRKVWTDALHMALGPSNPVQLAQREALSRQASAQRGRIDPPVAQIADAVAPANADSRKEKLRSAGALMKANPGASLEDLRRMMGS